MSCAIVDKTGAILNVIEADPAADTVVGATLVGIPDGVFGVDTRWVWSQKRGFTPPADVQAKIDASAAAAIADAKAAKA